MKRIKKIFGISLLVLGVLISIGAALNYPKLTILTGYSAKNMCSSIFIADRSYEFTDAHDNNFSPVNLADDEVNVENKFVTTSVFGLKERKAIYREGVGSVLVNDDFDTTAPYPKPVRNRVKRNLPFPYGDLPQKDTVFAEINQTSLQKAVAFGFENIEIAKTRSVMVLYKNQIIAERYANGYTASSRFLGWSMTKSVLATLFGIQEFEKKIDLDQKAGIEEWANDDRSNITIDHLLHMNSGLEWDEDYGGLSDVNQMLFEAVDMTQTQVKKETVAGPNEIWNYSSGTTNLLSGVLRKQFKTHQEYLDFPYKVLIDRMGMHSMLLEMDMSGNYVGSSYCWATTRDWAKFGLLYLNEGNWNGDQIFDSKWTNYVRTPAPNSEGKYGGHFWLNAGGFYPDAPRDMFSVNGFQGQRVFIIPSKELVIVRFGLIGDAGFDFNTFVKEIVNAIE
ncbi:serine hydrolase [Aquimarina sp. AU474]|uniref:serine hydrolase domain-containing protein n=1 Tax=Aquimarina sp. AU474 TaxID=2108529 RepID=UPI000D68764F|nr:serine hydrolase [Aquimarina sp. AU474]